MPRVHGIDVVPRRGRGGRIRSRPSAVAAARVDNENATATTTNSSIDFEEGMNDMKREEDNAVNDINGDTLRMSIDDNIINNENISTAASKDEGDVDMKAPLDLSESGGDTTEQITHTTNESLPPPTSIAAAAAIPSAQSNTIQIRPQARECLNQLQFGTHSFSVQDIHKKSQPKDTITDNNNNLHNDDTISSSIGLGPSLQRMNDTREEDGAQNDDMKLNSEMGAEETDTKEGGIQQEESKLDDNELSSRTTEEDTLESKLALSSAKINHDEDSNTHWLYTRCSAACKQMQTTSLSPLNLAIQTLNAIRSISDNYIDDDTKFSELLQNELFAVLKDVGKRRDMQFIFDVIERALELREDELLNEDRLLDVAGSNGQSDKNGEQASERDEGHTVQQHVGPDRIELNQEGNDSPRKVVHRSRRKKRPTNKDTTVAGDTGGGAHEDEQELSLHANDSGAAGEANDATITKDVAQHDDFPIAKDGLNMQDDDKWSFLPSTQLDTIDERGHAEDAESPRRVTRSMGGVPDVPEDNTTNVKECVKKKEERVIDEDEEETVKGNNKVESPSKYILLHKASHRKASPRKASPRKASPKRKATRRSSKKTSATKATPTSEESPINNDKEVYTKVKTRKRSETNDTVRIMFTGFTATQKHMQVSRCNGCTSLLNYIPALSSCNSHLNVPTR